MKAPSGHIFCAVQAAASHSFAPALRYSFVNSIQLDTSIHSNKRVSLEGIHSTWQRPSASAIPTMSLCRDSAPGSVDLFLPSQPTKPHLDLLNNTQ